MILIRVLRASQIPTTVTDLRIFYSRVIVVADPTDPLCYGRRCGLGTSDITRMLHDEGGVIIIYHLKKINFLNKFKNQQKNGRK